MHAEARRAAPSAAPRLREAPHGPSAGATSGPQARQPNQTLRRLAPQGSRVPTWMRRCGWRATRVAFAALLAARRCLLRLADALVPAELVVAEAAGAGMDAAVLRALVEQNIAAELVARGPQTAAQLAGALGLQADSTNRLCHFAASKGWLGVRHGGQFCANRRTRQLAHGGPGGAADFVRYMTDPGLRGAAASLGAVVRDGVDAFGHAHGHGVWAYFAAHSDEARTFDQAMAGLSARDAAEIAARLGPQNLAHLCDVGGGLGVFVEALLEQAPDGFATLLDTPEVVAAAGERLQHTAAGARVTLVGGDFFAQVPTGHSCYLLRTVLHDWDDEACQQILGRCVQAMEPGTTLAVVEAPLTHRGPWAALGARMDLTMLLATVRGRQRNRSELRRLLQSAGLQVASTTTLASPFELWLCHKAQP